jgi:NAD-dependent dihydropyrimidine dehydrogenase PreA subunit
MCEFCLKHGEGEKWYLQAENYSEDLLSDVRRRKFIKGFFSNPGNLADDIKSLEGLEKAPSFVRSLLTRMVTRKLKKIHYGQVVPLEEIKEIFQFVNSIIRVACLCRHVTLGKEQRYCYGISMGPNGGKFGEILRNLDSSYNAGPYSAGLEALSKEEALAAFERHEKEGLCHTVWTFQAPFVGGICNCDRADCLAMRCTVTDHVPIMFRAEYVAAVDPEKCEGCRQCMRVCQFGAIAYSPSLQKVKIDEKGCYGCGICRSSCNRKAIRLEDRRQVPTAATLW